MSKRKKNPIVRTSRADIAADCITLEMEVHLYQSVELKDKLRINDVAVADAMQAALTPTGKIFKLGDLVRKKTGSEWEGKVVGFYSTKLTPEGYCVESSTHAGSVQIYPGKALEKVQFAEHWFEGGRA